MATIYLGLGTNLGDRAANLRRALMALGPDVRVQRVSRCYESEPAYVLDQPRFLNLAAEAATDLQPAEVLERLKSIEVALGRVAGLRFGPRLIDLDLLLYGDQVLEAPNLIVPHPRMAERAFVLVPLAELAPALRHPRLGRAISELCQALGDTGAALWPAEVSAIWP